jgi:hypothetical protein
MLLIPEGRVQNSGPSPLGEKDRMRGFFAAIRDMN